MISPRGLGMILLCFGALWSASGSQRTDGYAVAAGPAGSQNASFAVPTEAEAHDGAMSMLQRRRQGQGQQRTDSVALALQGGGWYSVTLQSGVFAGMIYWLNYLDPKKPPTLDGSELMKKITLITSVSGGSWLVGGLIYSPFFMKTVEQLAQSPLDASNIWNKRWTKRLMSKDFSIAMSDVLLIIKECVLGTFMDPNQIDNDWLYAFKDLLVGVFDAGGSRQIFENVIIFTYFSMSTEVGGVGSQVFTWKEFVKEYMNRVCDIDATIPLGSTVNEWARTKEWIISVSQHNPARGNRVYAFYKQLVWVPITEYFAYKLKQAPGLEPTCGNSLSCELESLLVPDAAQASYGPHLYTPERFSVTLGAGMKQSAPYSWCPAPDICGKRRLEYWGRTLDWPFWPQVIRAPKTQGEFSKQAIEANAGKVSLLNAISGSSSAAALASLFPLPVFNPACSLSSMSTSIADSKDGKIFDAASGFLNAEKLTLTSGSNLMTPDLFAGANMLYQMVADGAYTDNTGIMTAVGAGARTVFALFATEGDFYSMFPQRGGGKDGERRDDGEDGEIINQYEKFHIFEEDMQEAVTNIKKGTKLECDGEKGLCTFPNFNFLRFISYGTMIATKEDTLDAREFGIKDPGKRVALHWVWTPSLIGILEPLLHGSNINSAENLADSYDALIQEVMNVMTKESNQPHVVNMLKNIGALER